MYDIQIIEVKRKKKELCSHFDGFLGSLMLIVGLHHINVECLAPNSVNKIRRKDEMSAILLFRS